MYNQLTINFSKDDVEYVNKMQQKVVILKEFLSNVIQVAWITFGAFERNTICWRNEYAVYASRANTAVGSIIDKQSLSQILPNGSTLQFKYGTFQLLNLNDTYPYTVEYVRSSPFDEEEITIGLAQPVIVNGQINAEPNIVSAQQMFFSNTITMIPEEKITVFMNSNTNNGQVINNMTNQAINLDFDQNYCHQSITYHNGTFILDKIERKY
ncbi:hypothetical protein [Chengkuizengella axinellae]|uniref:DUF2612 domain-containing protein n=1 Tax=Chengkuizengella axinellae TaxID=3064388 RepID=A0ABT9J610_9BACL|nr:hypothetical protein [Chengkuizengella sp. 2205SS18-9]MDP5277061.1 hypothetical protein [Chengkuizengella sp. 2205SS18-9]